MADAVPRESPPAIPGGRPPFLLGESKRILPAVASDFSAGTGIYSVTGRLRGRGSGRQWAFLLLLWLDRPSRSRRADLQTLAFFDLDNRDYGTSTETTRRYRLRRVRADRSPTSQGQLALSFQGSQGESTWHAHDGGRGALGVSASALHVVAVDAARRVMKLDLEVDAGKPALPLGGDHSPHTTTSTSPRWGRGSFQSGVRFSGKFAWGEEQEDVDGDGGWIAHRFASRLLRPHGRSGGNRHSPSGSRSSSQTAPRSAHGCVSTEIARIAWSRQASRPPSARTARSPPPPNFTSSAFRSSATPGSMLPQTRCNQGGTLPTATTCPCRPGASI